MISVGRRPMSMFLEQTQNDPQVTKWSRPEIKNETIKQWHHI